MILLLKPDFNLKAEVRAHIFFTRLKISSTSLNVVLGLGFCLYHVHTIHILGYGFLFSQNLLPEKILYTPYHMQDKWF